MSRNILILLCHDLAYSFRNRSFFLVLFIPLFVFASLNLTDQSSPASDVVDSALVAVTVLSDPQRETLPTWVLMLVLLVGFIILPMQVAEEKEKKLLLALLQTPIHEFHWLLAKVLLGMVLATVGILLLHVLGQFSVEHYPDYIAVILAGSFCFSAFGIFLGFLCRSQASARTLGVVFFLPLLLPAAMADVSTKLTALAPWLPSYQLFRPLQAILLEDGAQTSIAFYGVNLLLLGTVMLFLAFALMKRRWP